MDCTIAAILPLGGKNDTLADTLLDGMRWLQREGHAITFHTSAPFDSFNGVDYEPNRLEQDAFAAYAQLAKLIILFYGKKGTDIALAERIGR